MANRPSKLLDRRLQKVALLVFIGVNKQKVERKPERVGDSASYLIHRDLQINKKQLHFRALIKLRASVQSEKLQIKVASITINPKTILKTAQINAE